MKRGAVLFLCIFLVLFISFAFAGFFSNFFGKIFRGGEPGFSPGLGEKELTDKARDLTPYEQARCSDSDYGFNIYERGKCVYVAEGVNETTNFDVCIDSNEINEFYCDSNTDRCVSLPKMCPGGYVCSEGACVEENNETCGNGEPDEGEFCDYANPDDPYTELGICEEDCTVYGSVSGWEGCHDSGAHVCEELVDDQYFIDNPLCARNDDCGDFYGMCNEIVCPDPNVDECGNGEPDEGEFCDYANPDDPYTELGVCENNCVVYGIVGDWRGCQFSGAHVCEELVDDQYFIDNPLCVRNDGCDNNYYDCNEIVCSEPELGGNETCYDSDGGLNYYVQGTCIDPGSTSRDFCVDGARLWEHYCNEDFTICESHNYSCPYGCESGICLEDLNDSTPPVLDIFELGINDSGNQTSINLYARAHDYESGMQLKFYAFSGPGGDWGGGPCTEGDVCQILTEYNNPESGLWNVTVFFTNNADLSVSDIQSIYVPGKGFFAKIIEFLRT